MAAKPRTIDDYLARVPADRQRALRTLRATIHRLLPGAEECISYSMPAFRYQGHVVAGFLATGKGCSYFPFSGSTLATLATELGDYEQTKSALHFAPEEPLSKAIVKKLLQARIAETTQARPARNGAGRRNAKPKGVNRRVATAATGRTPKPNGARVGKAPKKRLPARAAK